MHSFILYDMRYSTYINICYCYKMCGMNIGDVRSRDDLQSYEFNWIVCGLKIKKNVDHNFRVRVNLKRVSSSSSSSRGCLNINIWRQCFWITKHDQRASAIEWERETCNTYYYCYGITFSLFMRFISQKYAVFIVAVASEWERGRFNVSGMKGIK